MMIYEKDSYLEPFKAVITARYQEVVRRKQELAGYGGRLSDKANNHLFYGVHRVKNERV